MKSSAPLLNAGITPPLSPRERDVLRELALGNPNKIIARNLSISPHTVGAYVKDIYRKLEVNNRTKATIYAIQNGICRLDS